MPFSYEALDSETLLVHGSSFGQMAFLMPLMAYMGAVGIEVGFARYKSSASASLGHGPWYMYQVSSDNLELGSVGLKSSAVCSHSKSAANEAGQPNLVQSLNSALPSKLLPALPSTHTLISAFRKCRNKLMSCWGTGI